MFSEKYIIAMRDMIYNEMKTKGIDYDKAYKNVLRSKEFKDMLNPHNITYQNNFYNLNCNICHGVGCLECSMIKDKKREFLTCDGNFCFTFVENGSYPICLVDGQPLYLNTPSHTHGKYCLGKMVVSNGNNMELIYDLNRQREAIAVSGPSRCGKTTWARMYAEKYAEQFPDNRIYLFSKKENDISFDDIEHIKIIVDEEFFETGSLNYKDYANSLIIFDDIENLGDTKEQKAEIRKFIDDILMLAGDQQISTIVIPHILRNGSFTRVILKECSKFVLFPTAGAKYQYVKFLSEYIGISENKAKRILKTNSRYIIVFTDAPVMFMTKKRIYMSIY